MRYRSVEAYRERELERERERLRAEYDAELRQRILASEEDEVWAEQHARFNKTIGEAVYTFDCGWGC